MVAIVAVAIEEAILEVAAVAVDHLESLELVINLSIYKLSILQIFKNLFYFSESYKITLYTNYIELLNEPNWILYQYHVDFEPDIQSRRLRVGLLNQHSQLFGAKAFDGKTLFTLTRLDNEVINNYY
jgi:hypothetical protein